MMRKQESWAGSRAAAPSSAEESRPGGDHSRNLSCGPLTSCPIPAVSSPGEPASLLNLKVLENWNGYQIAHLRGLRAPGKVNLAGRDSEPAAALPLGGPWSPLGEEHEAQRSPPQLQAPDV